MTHIRSLILSLLLAVGACAMAQYPHFIDTNPGIVESSSIAVAALPTRAMFFIDTYYPGVDVRTMTEAYLPKIYQVTMDNGTYMEFDAEGHMMKVEAPEGKTLPIALLQGELSQRAFDELSIFGGEDAATTIEATPRGPRVSFENKTMADLDIAHALF